MAAWLRYHVFITFAATCCHGGIKSSKSIIGGDDAPPGRYRFMAVILYNDEFTCGGSLITRQHVLTAKHCVIDNEISKYMIVLGEYDRSVVSEEEQNMTVSIIIRDSKTDTAIVTLNNHATLNQNVSLVHLYSGDLKIGEAVIAMGWGWTIHRNRDSLAEKLQHLEITIGDREICKELPHDFLLKEEEMCCGNPHLPEYANICSGDSGSPLIYLANGTADYQVGIAVRSPAFCPETETYAAFTNVSAIFTWIVCNTNYLEMTRTDIDCSSYATSTTVTTPAHLTDKQEATQATVDQSARHNEFSEFVTSISIGNSATDAEWSTPNPSEDSVAPVWQTAIAIIGGVAGIFVIVFFLIILIPKGSRKIAESKSNQTHILTNGANKFASDSQKEGRPE